MIVIVDYQMGNVRSVLKAFERLEIDAVISSKIEDINSAEKLILPGVGHFKKGMENLYKLNLAPILKEKVLGQKTPILGICLGMQLFARESEEGDCAGLGWIDAKAVKFNFGKNSRFRAPHIGWNSMNLMRESPVLEGVAIDDLFYFVHSYYVICKHDVDVVATTEYGETFSSLIQKENIYGVQFHPEKSHKNGLRILDNFSRLI